jgi:hypothetical protein
MLVAASVPTGRAERLGRVASAADIAADFVADFAARFYSS